MIRNQRLRCPACNAYLFHLSTPQANIDTICRKCPARVVVIVKDDIVSLSVLPRGVVH